MSVVEHCVCASYLPDVVTQARAAQEPITSTGRLIVDGACQMIQSAKQLALNPKDPLTYQQYSAHSHDVSEAIKNIVSAIRYCIPLFKFCMVSSHE